MDRTIPNPIPDGYECMWSEAMCGRALYCQACYGSHAPANEPEPCPDYVTCEVSGHTATADGWFHITRDPRGETGT